LHAIDAGPAGVASQHVENGTRLVFRRRRQEAGRIILGGALVRIGLLQQGVQLFPHGRRQPFVHRAVQAVLVGPHRCAGDPLHAVRRRRFDQPRRTLDRQLLDQSADVASSRDRMIACPCAQRRGIGDRRLAEAEQCPDFRSMPFHGAAACEEGGTRLDVDAKCRGQAYDLGFADISSGLWKPVVRTEEQQQHRKAEAPRAALRGNYHQVAGRQRPSRLGSLLVEQGTGLAACLRGLPGQQLAATRLGFTATVDVGVQGAERDPKLIGDIAGAIGPIGHHGHCGAQFGARHQTRTAAVAASRPRRCQTSQRSLLDQVPLELRQGGEYPEHQAAGRAGGVDAAGQHLQTGATGLEVADQTDHMVEGTTDAIEFPHDKGIIGPHGIERAAEAGTFVGHAAAGVFIEPLAAGRLQRIALKMVGLISGRHTHVTDQHRRQPSARSINHTRNGFCGHRKIHEFLRASAVSQSRQRNHAREHIKRRFSAKTQYHDSQRRPRIKSLLIPTTLQMAAGDTTVGFTPMKDTEIEVLLLRQMLAMNA